MSVVGERQVAGGNGRNLSDQKGRISGYPLFWSNLFA